MFNFKIAVTYTNYCFEEIIEIEAESKQQAEEKCGEIKEQNKMFVEECAKKNIFVSRKIKDCRLCRMTLSEEMRKCEEILSEIKK